MRLNTFCTTLFTYNVKMFSRMDQFNATSSTLPGEEGLKTVRKLSSSIGAKA